MDLSTLITGAVVVLAVVLVLYAIQARRSAARFASGLTSLEQTPAETVVVETGSLSGWSRSTTTGFSTPCRKMERRDAETRILGIVGRRGRLHRIRCTRCTVDGRELTEVVPVSENGEPLGDPEFHEESISESIERLL